MWKYEYLFALVGTIRSSVSLFRNVVTIFRNGGTDSLHFKKGNGPSNFCYIGCSLLRYSLTRSFVTSFLRSRFLRYFSLSERVDLSTNPQTLLWQRNSGLLGSHKGGLLVSKSRVLPGYDWALAGSVYGLPALDIMPFSRSHAFVIIVLSIFVPRPWWTSTRNSTSRRRRRGRPRTTRATLSRLTWNLVLTPIALKLDR